MTPLTAFILGVLLGSVVPLVLLIQVGMYAQREETETRSALDEEHEELTPTAGYFYFEPEADENGSHWIH